jgi:hypothetical protein
MAEPINGCPGDQEYSSANQIYDNVIVVVARGGCLFGKCVCVFACVQCEREQSFVCCVCNCVCAILLLLLLSLTPSSSSLSSSLYPIYSSSSSSSTPL